MTISSSPFSLNSDTSYQRWREKKLEYFTQDVHSLFIEINDIASLNSSQKKALVNQVKHYNMAFYRFTRPSNHDATNKIKVHALAHQLGLRRIDKNICADDDKLTSIMVSQHKGQHNYIPYSNKRLSWHTDGYYNEPSNQINGMLLHCERPAKTGGESLLMDHDLAYILLRDENLDYIKALMHPNAMTIPANVLKGKEIRAEQTGAVFSIHPSGALHMRYSARTRNIQWRDNSPTKEAVTFLQNLWKNGSPYILKHSMQAHEGIICNNVLHCRTEFTDSDDLQKKRLLYRGRYLDRVSTSLSDNQYPD